MSKELIKFEGPQDIRETELVRLSRKLLESVVSSTDILNKNKMTENGLKEAKLVLGFLNATTSAVKTKMQFFKMIGLDDKIREVAKRAAK